MSDEFMPRSERENDDYQLYQSQQMNILIKNEPTIC